MFQRLGLVRLPSKKMRGTILCSSQFRWRETAALGRIIVSCVINDEGVTNTRLEARLKTLGYDDDNAKCLQGVRRIRGPPEERLPPNAKTPKEIIHTTPGKSEP
jgi:hypothetical protein